VRYAAGFTPLWVAAGDLKGDGKQPQPTARSQCDHGDLRGAATSSSALSSPSQTQLATMPVVFTGRVNFAATTGEQTER
jgi:hypothetical protein